VKEREGVNKIALVLLTFFLGGIGAHKFYLGKYVQGVLYFLFSWTFIPSFIAFVEFLIYAFTSEESLQQKYEAKASVAIVIIAACAGFMVLVAILGIIAAIAIPQFAMYRNRAREAALESELKNLMSAQYAYFEAHNRYASDLADLKFVKSSPDIVLEVVSADRDCFEAKAAFEGHNKEMWADCEGITGAREGTRAAAATGRGSFSSEEGGFSVLFPGTPNENSQSVQTAAGPIELTMFLFEDGTGAYLVGYSDYPDKIIASASSEQLLDNAIRGGMGNTGGILVGQESIAIDGYPGKEISFRVPSSRQMPGGGKGMARYYLMGNRLYQVLIVTGADRDRKDFVRFLDSFRLL
jgi:TM2 domain-containing membrane protein YozV